MQNIHLTTCIAICKVCRHQQMHSHVQTELLKVQYLIEHSLLPDMFLLEDTNLSAKVGVVPVAPNKQLININSIIQLTVQIDF